MNNSQLGESVNAVLGQMSGLLGNNNTLRTPVFEMNIKGKPYQAVIQLIPKGSGWLEHGEIEIKGKDAGSISITP